MRTLLFVILGLAGGAVAGAIILAFAIDLISSNTHDRSLEAQMTGIFVGGPLGALAGAFGGWSFARRRTGTPAQP